MEYFTDALKQYANFTGRATRKQYWMFILFYVIFYIAAVVVDAILGIMAVTTIYILGLLVPSIAIAARRLHDTGRTGWWQLLLLIPLIGAIVLLVFLVQDSGPDNQHGPNPKAAPEPAAT